MESTYRSLGTSGLRVSKVGLGCNNFGNRVDIPGSKAVIDAAIDAGVNFLDTSDSYGDSEEILGRSLGSRRNRVVLATKFGSDLGDANGPDWGARASRRYIHRAVERSLRRLRTDWIDLYQLHRPDGFTPFEEILGTLDDLVHDGKIRYVGSSGLRGWEISNCDWIARINGWERFISTQNLYNLLDREIEAEVIPACVHHGVGLLPYFPLASGLLTGKYTRGEKPPPGTRLATWSFTNELTDRRFDVVERIETFAKERSIRILDVAIGGLAAKPGVASVISGATTPEQVLANVAAGAWEPTDDDMAALGEITRQHDCEGQP